MNLEYWPNYVRMREFIYFDKRRHGFSADNLVQPNKMQRTNDINGSEANSTENQEVGFQQEIVPSQLERNEQMEA